MSATDRLDTALRDLAEQGRFPPCSYDPESWFEGTPEDRAHAAELCQGCPVLTECAAVAGELPRPLHIGVWAGVDLTRAPSRRRDRPDGTTDSPEGTPTMTRTTRTRTRWRCSSCGRPIELAAAREHHDECVRAEQVAR